MQSTTANISPQLKLGRAVTTSSKEHGPLRSFSITASFMGSMASDLQLRWGAIASAQYFMDRNAPLVSRSCINIGVRNGLRIAQKWGLAVEQYRRRVSRDEERGGAVGAASCQRSPSSLSAGQQSGRGESAGRGELRRGWGPRRVAYCRRVRRKAQGRSSQRIFDRFQNRFGTSNEYRS